jgi:hypothetical protein
MAYKTILLVLNEVERALQLIETARSLAVKFGAHISGLYVIPGIMAYPSDGLSMGAGLGVGSFDGHRKHFMDRLRNVRGEFETAMRSDDLSFDFHVVDSDIPIISTSVIDNCRTSDLIIISAIDRENTSSVESDFVEQVVLAAGRPVLVLPFEGEYKLNSTILFWRGMRQKNRRALLSTGWILCALRKLHELSLSINCLIKIPSQWTLQNLWTAMVSTAS